MNKKVLGIKIGTILTAFVCLIVSFVVWMLVKYSLGADAAFVIPGSLALFRG